MTAESGPLGNISLAATTFYVSDLDAAVAWYGERLGLEPMSMGADAERYAAFLVGGSILVLEPRTAALDPADPGNESTTVNLVVDKEPRLVHAELVGRGVVCSAIVDSPHYSSFLVRDLEGNRFYVSRPVTAEAQQDLTDAAGAITSAQTGAN
jgi:catechol 2,3-dioxygenase-like lactoylglutathione lyase family enzyme